MTKLIVTFLNFANARENAYALLSLRFIICSQCYEHSEFDSDKYTSTSWGSNPSVKIGFPPEIIRSASYQADVITVPETEPLCVVR